VHAIRGSGVTWQSRCCPRWAMPTDGGPMRQITDFGRRAILIARTAYWSSDSRSVYAAVAEMDADIVLLEGIDQRPSDSFHRVSTLPPEWRLFR
jgi:hypothetical protein